MERRMGDIWMMLSKSKISRGSGGFRRLLLEKREVRRSGVKSTCGRIAEKKVFGEGERVGRKVGRFGWGEVHWVKKKGK